MTRISRNSLVQAIATVRAMDKKQREQFAAELVDRQPNLFAAFLVQKRFGASLAKMDFLLDILFICFQAMKESGLPWPLITEEDLDQQMRNHLASIEPRGDEPRNLPQRFVRKRLEDHPEQALLGYVQAETANWLERIAPEENDKYIVIAAATFVNCVAFVPIPGTAPVPAPAPG